MMGKLLSRFQHWNNILKDARLPRKGEAIGGGFFVFRRGSSTNRIITRRWMFEHPTYEAALAEATRLKLAFPEDTFVVLGEVTPL